MPHENKELVKNTRYRLFKAWKEQFIEAHDRPPRKDEYPEHLLTPIIKNDTAYGL